MLGKSLKDGVLEELEKGALNPVEISVRLRLPLQYVRYELSMLEEEGLIEYYLKTGNWRISRK